MRKIRVLVVDDSLLFRNLLVQSLSEDPYIEVVAQAGDAYAARDAILQYRPDVMTLDVEMPKMGGIEFLRKLLPQYPLPVVVISAMSAKVFDAMEAGAVDFVCKPNTVDRSKVSSFLRRIGDQDKDCVNREGREDETGGDASGKQLTDFEE